MPEPSRLPKKLSRWILYFVVTVGMMGAFFVINRAAYESSLYSLWSESATGLSAVAGPPVPHMERPVEGTPASAGPNITRSSWLYLRTQKFDRAVSQIPEIVHKQDGYLEEWKIQSGSRSGRWLEASFRVAAQRADSTLAELKAFGDVQQESEANEDVGLEKETLAEKLQAERGNLARLEQIVRQHKASLHEVVEAEEQMVSLRAKVGDLERHWKKLLARGAYATVSLTLGEDFRKTLQWNSSHSSLYLRNSWIEGMGAILSSLTFASGLLLHYGPSLGLWSGLVYVVFRLGRHFRRRSAALHASAGA